jgi:hypothetical protein
MMPNVPLSHLRLLPYSPCQPSSRQEVYALIHKLAEMRLIPIIVCAIDLGSLIKTCAVTTVRIGLCVLCEREGVDWIGIPGK